MSSLSSSSTPPPKSIRLSSSSSGAATSAVVKKGTKTKTTSTGIVKKVQLEEKNKNIHYEFGGPIGTFFIIIGLPVVIYFLFFICNKDICYISSSLSSISFDWNEFFRYFLSYLSWNKLFSIEATYIYIGMI
jgi:hypothetical protein